MAGAELKQKREFFPAICRATLNSGATILREPVKREFFPAICRATLKHVPDALSVLGIENFSRRFAGLR